MSNQLTNAGHGPVERTGAAAAGPVAWEELPVGFSARRSVCAVARESSSISAQATLKAMVLFM